MESTLEELLKNLYYNPRSECAFSSLERLWNRVRREYPSALKAEVKSWLEQQDAYTLHTKADKNIRGQRKVYVSRINQQFAADLCDMTNVAHANDGVRYMLTVIDVMSKFAFVESVARKSGLEVTAAFDKILKKTNRRPERCETDRGKEFYNTNFKSLMKDIGCEHFSTYSVNKASVVERFNRSIKSMIYKYFAAKRTQRWIDVVQSLVRAYNNRKHRSIGMSPASVTKRDEAALRERLYPKTNVGNRRFYLNDLVRITRQRRTFDKGYYPTYTLEIFRIVKVNYFTRPYTYYLCDLLDEPVEGTFAGYELQKVRKDEADIWSVEKVIRRDRRGRALVKWLGYPEKFNSWINVDQLE